MAQTARLLDHDTAERRTSDRRPIAQDSTVRAADSRPIASIVHDLSTGGATVETQSELAIGSTITIGLPSVGRQVATIVRRSGNRYACRFEEPLDAAYVERAFVNDPVVVGAFVLAGPLQGAAALPEPVVEKWHPALRVTLMIGLASAMWSAILHIF